MRKIIGICGESGSGKTTIIDTLCKTYHIHKIVETTDRPMRTNEKQGSPYNFVTQEQFLDMIWRGKIVAPHSFKVKHEQGQFSFGLAYDDIPQHGIHIMQCNYKSLAKLERHFGDDFVSIQIVRNDKDKLLSALSRTDSIVYEVCDRFIRDKEHYSKLETDYIVQNDDFVGSTCEKIYKDIILRS